MGHDLKLPYEEVPLKELTGSGFVHNTSALKGSDIGDDKAARTLGMSQSVHGISSSVWGERSQTSQQLEEDPAVVSAVALARAKRQTTGFKSNSDGYIPHQRPFEEARPPILLVQQTMGTKDPIMRENGWRGPAFMSTTSRQAFVAHPMADPNCLEGKEVDLYGQKVPAHGAFNNQVNTVNFNAHMPPNILSETHDKFRPFQAAVSDGDLAARVGAKLPLPEEIPFPVSSHGLKPTGLAIVDCIRQALFNMNGIGGIHAFARRVRKAGSGAPARLRSEELRAILEEFDLPLPPSEMEELMRSFDRERSGSVLVETLVAGVRGRTSQARIKLIRQAFKQLSANDEPVGFQEMLGLFDPSFHPEVLRGSATPQQIFNEFASDWDKAAGDSVSHAEFQDYCENLSGCIESDDYFELLLRNAWHVSGGQGVASSCVACRRFLVCFADGRKSVETLKNDLKVPWNDFDKIHASLVAQGLLDIVSIVPMDGVHGSEPGNLQTAALQNRSLHHAQEARGIPGRASAINTTDTLTGAPIGVSTGDMYLSRLSPKREARMAREDPVEYSVYKGRNLMQTTSQATYCPHKNKYTTSLEEVVALNEDAVRAAQDANGTMARYRALTSHPERDVADGGYARNNQMAKSGEAEACGNPRKLNLKQAATARVGDRLAYESSGQTTIYRSDYRDQSKIPINTTHLVELRKQPTGYNYDNAWHVLPLVPDGDSGSTALARSVRRLGVPSLDAIRQRLSERGTGGFRALTRILRAMDHNGTRLLDYAEFEAGLKACGLTLTAAELEQLLQVADKDQTGGISVSDFLRSLRGPMSERRAQLIRLAYGALDKGRTNAVPVPAMVAAYDCLQHPDVMRRRRSPEQVKQEFVAAWGPPEGGAAVAAADFQEFYTDVSAAIDSDDYFELLMRNCWHIP